MSQHGYSIYSEDIGSRFLEEQLNKRLLSASYSRSLRSVIRRLNDECYETQYIRRHTGGCEKPPPQWSTILADYLLLCKQKGNHDNTIKNKYHFCTRFLNILSDLGLQNLSNINASTTVHACLRLTNKGAYIEIRRNTTFSGLSLRSRVSLFRCIKDSSSLCTAIQTTICLFSR